jgi:DNA-binding CsgD family transcriptional regulator
MPNEVDDLDRTYLRLAVAFSDAMDAGQEREAARLRQRIVRLLWGALPGPAPRRPFLELVDDPRPWVRYWAAAGALRVDPDQSRKVFGELAELQGTVGESARESLQKHFRPGGPWIWTRADGESSSASFYPAPRSRLTDRQIQVLELWCAASGDIDAVARRLGLHQSVVTHHINFVCDQYRVESWEELWLLTCSE